MICSRKRHPLRRTLFFLPLTVTAILAASLFPSHVQAKTRAKVEMKLATLAPDGSTWMTIMDELDEAIREKTNGEAGLKFYPGGIQGDEAVVLRKVRAGQLHGGGFTGVGLGEIAPALRVMEVPFLFRDIEEIRVVQERLGPKFEEILRESGWELLGWADVGFVYLFSKDPIRRIEDLKKVRMWLWEGDPLAETFLTTVGVSPVPLPITDVVTSLQTGLIDAVYTSPMACIALQWFTRVSSMTDLPVVNAIGAVVVSRKQFEKLAPSSREIVKELSGEYFGRLLEATTRENDESVGVLQERGIEMVTLAQADRAGFDAVGQTVREAMVGKLYSRELLDDVLQVLDEHRTSRINQGP